MILALLGAVLGAAHALAVEPPSLAAEGAPGETVSFDLLVLAEGPVHAEAPGRAALGGSGERALPTEFPACPERPCALRFVVVLPEEPATFDLALSDAEGGILVPVRLVPRAAAPPPEGPVTSEADDPGPPAPEPPATEGAPRPPGVPPAPDAERPVAPARTPPARLPVPAVGGLLPLLFLGRLRRKA